MFSGVKLQIKHITSKFKQLLVPKSDKASQWLWFAFLWVSGLLTITILSYLIKCLINIKI